MRDTSGKQKISVLFPLNISTVKKRPAEKKPSNCHQGLGAQKDSVTSDLLNMPA